jgi:hypothetical protein
MLLKPVRASFLIGLVAAVAAAPAHASHHGSGCCEAPCATPCAAPCAPAMQTVQCTEWVRENYTTTRTAYRVVCKQEAYTCYRCENVMEQRTRTCTYYERVPVVRTVTRKVCEMVPAVEERTCMKPHWSYVTETKMVCKRVDRGHWECREVYCFRKDMMNRLHKLCHRHKDCCCECNSCCEECPAPTRTKKVWCSCWVTEQCPTTCCRKVCTMVPEKVCVRVCRPVYKTVTCQETVCTCVAKHRVVTENVCVRRMVPVQATRTVRVCVPFQETVTCCRMVPRVVTRQVPCAVANACCANVCCEEHAPRCHRRLFGGLWGHHHNECDGCGEGCGGCH